MTVLDKAAAAVDLIMQSAEPIGLAPAAVALGMPKSSLHRLLGALCQLDLVRRDSTGRYLPGVRLLGWGLNADLRYDIRGVATPIVAELARSTGESVNLNVLSGEHRVCVVAVDGAATAFRPITVGETLPLGIGATGRLLLAHSSASTRDAVRDRLVASGHPCPSEEELAEIRAERWAVSTNGLRIGLAAGAALVAGPDGQAMAALAIGGDLDRMTATRLAELRPRVTEAAARIAQQCLVSLTAPQPGRAR